RRAVRAPAAATAAAAASATATSSALPPRAFLVVERLSPATEDRWGGAARLHWADRLWLAGGYVGALQALYAFPVMSESLYVLEERAAAKLPLSVPSVVAHTPTV